VCHMPRPPHSPWFDLLNDILCWVQIMKLPIVQRLNAITGFNYYAYMGRHRKFFLGLHFMKVVREIIYILT
jgi:hypothetical protein